MNARAITPEEVKTFQNELLRTFGFDGQGEDDAMSRFVELVPLSRTYAVFDGDQMVGTSAAFEFELSVPGGVVPMAGLTMVTVRPTHRRRGIMREMIRAYHDDIADRGEPLGGLWASEAPIYGRFGFGVAAEGDDVELDVSGMSFDWPEALDEVSLVDEDEAMAGLPDLYDRARMRRPGMLSRTAAWWRNRRVFDPPERRAGASSKRRCVALRGDSITGYVEFRHRPKLGTALPAGTIEIVELIGVDTVATASLWRFITNVDLFPRVKWWNAPVDSQLPWMTADRRRILRTRNDTLWLRVCDVPAALARRTYDVDGRLRLAVNDPPGGGQGVFELVVEQGEASCARTTQEPDISMDRSTLGSLYLGAVSASVLARAGRIDGGDSAVSRAARMFRSQRAPWCPEVF